MTQQNQVYKCNICGNIVEVLHDGAGELVCCGESMKLQEEKGVAQEGEEKHVPVIEKTEKGYLVKIGLVPHPMEENHHIEWIELVAEGKRYKKFLRPGDAPEAEFEIQAENVSAREYCNVHGLWANTN
jgi:superoxide reductase